MSSLHSRRALEIVLQAKSFPVCQSSSNLTVAYAPWPAAQQGAAQQGVQRETRLGAALQSPVRGEGLRSDQARGVGVRQGQGSWQLAAGRTYGRPQSEVVLQAVPARKEKGPRYIQSASEHV